MKLDPFILIFSIVFVLVIFLLIIWLRKTNKKYTGFETLVFQKPGWEKRFSLFEGMTTTGPQTTASVLKYDSNNYNMTYHDEPAENGLDTLGDVSGNNILDRIGNGGNYSQTASSNYVPNYENSVYLSTSNKASDLEKNEIHPNNENPLGFCATDPLTREEKCNKLSKGVCADAALSTMAVILPSSVSLPMLVMTILPCPFITDAPLKAIFT
jgi:hypothetical protein